jgi:cell division protein FtsL
MLRTTPVPQSPPVRTSLRRISVSQQTAQHGERAHVPQHFRFGPLLLGFFLCLAGVVVYMWPRVQVVRLAYRVQTSEQHLRALDRQRDQFRFELASLKDPQRIYRVATDQLGMSIPRRDQIVLVTREPKSR